jgi:hypothetical protein
MAARRYVKVLGKLWETWVKQVILAAVTMIAAAACSKPAEEATAPAREEAAKAGIDIAANVPQDMIDGPAPGQWKMTMAMDNGMTLPEQEICYKERISFEDAQKMQAEAGMECSEQSFKRDGAAVVGHAVCTMNGMKIVTDTRVTGDFDTAYEMEITSTMDPAPMPDMAKTTMKASMTRIGDC